MAPSSSFRPLLRALAVSSALSLPFGCLGDDGHTDSGGGTEGGTGDPCEMCGPGENAYSCVYDGAFQGYDCADMHSNASCAPGTAVITPTVCDNHSAVTSPTWDPGLDITWNAGLGVYEIDEDFLDTLKVAPHQLLHDAARVDWQDPYFKVVNVNSGDFVDELGIQTGDYLISLSGYPLSSIAEVAEAVSATQSQAAWSLVIYRGSSYTTLYYREM